MFLIQESPQSKRKCLHERFSPQKQAESTEVWLHPPPQKLDSVIHNQGTFVSLMLALLFAALGSFAAASAQAAVLVKNTGQMTSGNNANLAAWSFAQGFTTGSSTNGYTLESIGVTFRSGGNAAQSMTLHAELWSAATGGGPGSKTADLTVPTTISAGVTTFTAPASTTLTAGTTYYVVFYTVGTFNPEGALTAATAEDSGGATGWTIEDTGYIFRADTPAGSSSWASGSGNVFEIEVNGAEKTTTQTLSSDNTLSALSATSATGETGAYSTLSIGTFASTMTSYSATVPNATTHVKLTPTVNHSSARVTVRGTTVSSGSESAAIPLSVGTNTITVRVTAQDLTTKDYTVTITRRPRTAASATVSLSAPNSVLEGRYTFVTATLSAALSEGVTIPVTVTPGNAEPEDYSVGNPRIIISAGTTRGSLQIQTTEDTDTEDETFTVALGSPLPQRVAAGNPKSVRITIEDKQASFERTSAEQR